MHSRPVSVTEIARKAGVAQSTVSAALHGRGRVGEASRQRILALARELGYEPRLAAQLLRAKSTGQIGLVIAATDSVEAFAGQMAPLVLGHFIKFCTDQRLGYLIEFHHHEQDEAGEFRPPQQVAARMVDGIVVMGDVGDDLRRTLAARTGFPWVSVEEPAPLCVLSASDVAVYEATRDLAAMGHRRLAYAGGPQRYTQQRLGLEGFARAATELGLSTTRQLFRGRLDAETAAHAVRDVVVWARALIRGADRPTAFVCHNDTFARAVIHAAIEQGRRVPEDLSVISYGSALEAARTYPRLTTIENDYKEITAQAMVMLQQRLSGKAVAETIRRVKPRLIAGETVAPVGRGGEAT